MKMPSAARRRSRSASASRIAQFQPGMEQHGFVLGILIAPCLLQTGRIPNLPNRRGPNGPPRTQEPLPTCDTDAE